ncbi:MAG: hypothetical protein P8X55_03880 [Desulfosarcinaceae bacterium]
MVLVEQQAVGAQVHRKAAAGKPVDDLEHIAACQRFTAGDADLVNGHGLELHGQAKIVVQGHGFHPRVAPSLAHAAAAVAAVGDIEFRHVGAGLGRGAVGIGHHVAP